MTQRIDNEEAETIVMGFRTTSKTRRMIRAIQRKYNQGRGEALRKAIENEYIFITSKRRGSNAG